MKRYDNPNGRKSWVDFGQSSAKSNIHAKKVLVCKGKSVGLICTSNNLRIIKN